MPSALRCAFLLALCAAPSGALRADPPAAEDESWWRERAAAQLAAIERLEQAVADCEEREAPPIYDGVEGYVTRGRDGRLRATLIKRCDEERADLDAARRDFDRLEEEARRRGVPPGWLR